MPTNSVCCMNTRHKIKCDVIRLEPTLPLTYCSYSFSLIYHKFNNIILQKYLQKDFIKTHKSDNSDAYI